MKHQAVNTKSLVFSLDQKFDDYDKRRNLSEYQKLPKYLYIYL